MDDARTGGPPVMGSLLEITSAGMPPLRLYLSGDTLVHERRPASWTG